LSGRHERLDADRAYQLGIVSEVVPDVRAAARALAEKIARNPPEALRLVKQQLWRALELGLSDARREAATMIAQAPRAPGWPSTQPELLGEPAASGPNSGD
jgi:enoyl-CoA hydratase/carnithine racemase